MKYQIIEMLKAHRPNFSQSSLTTYSSIISAYMKRNKLEDLSYFDKKIDEVISRFKDSTPMARKTKLSAFFIMTRNKKYQEAMMKDCTTVNDHYKLQKKSEREETG
jgi:hypothetical protein